MVRVTFIVTNMELVVVHNFRFLNTLKRNCGRRRDNSFRKGDQALSSRVSKQYNLFLTALQVSVVGRRMANMEKMTMPTFVDLKRIVSFLTNCGFSYRKCWEWMLPRTLYCSIKFVGCFHLEPPLSKW